MRRQHATTQHAQPSPHPCPFTAFLNCQYSVLMLQPRHCASSQELPTLTACSASWPSSCRQSPADGKDGGARSMSAPQASAPPRCRASCLGRSQPARQAVQLAGSRGVRTWQKASSCVPHTPMHQPHACGATPHPHPNTHTKTCLGALELLQHLCMHRHVLQVGLAHAELAAALHGQHATQGDLAAGLHLQEGWVGGWVGICVCVCGGCGAWRASGSQERWAAVRRIGRARHAALRQGGVA